MTSLALDSNNDLVVVNGQLVLIDTLEELVRHRLLNKLRTFTGTLFTNVNYGIDASLVFEKNTKDLLDQNIKTLISNTEGVTKLSSFTSSVSTDRVYTCTFEAVTENGTIVGLSVST